MRQRCGESNAATRLGADQLRPLANGGAATRATETGLYRTFLWPTIANVRSATNEFNELKLRVRTLSRISMQRDSDERSDRARDRSSSEWYSGDFDTGRRDPATPVPAARDLAQTAATNFSKREISKETSIP
jgi:hypothetical protein